METQEYKGVDGYLKTILGLSDTDIAQIKNNLQADDNLQSGGATGPIFKL